MSSTDQTDSVNEKSFSHTWDGAPERARAHSRHLLAHLKDNRPKAFFLVTRGYIVHPTTGKIIIDHADALPAAAARSAGDTTSFPRGTSSRPVPATPASTRSTFKDLSTDEKLSYLVAPHLIDAEDLVILGIISKSITDVDVRKELCDDTESGRVVLQRIENKATTVSTAIVARQRIAISNHATDGCDPNEAAFGEWKDKYAELVEVLPAPPDDATTAQYYLMACMRWPEVLREFIDTTAKTEGKLSNPAGLSLIIKEKLNKRKVFEDLAAPTPDVLAVQKNVDELRAALVSAKKETNSLRQRINAKANDWQH